MNSYIKYLNTRIKFTFILIKYNKIYLMNENGIFYKIVIKDFAKPIYFLYKRYYYFGSSNVLSESENIYSFLMYSLMPDSTSESGYKLITNYFDLNNFSSYDMLIFINKLDRDYINMKNLKSSIKSSNNYNLNLNF
jgi:hypothetical protein